MKYLLVIFSLSALLFSCSSDYFTNVNNESEKGVTYTTIKVPTAAITVDGDLSDWNSITAQITGTSTKFTNVSTSSDVNIKELAIAQDDTYVYFLYSVYGQLDKNYGYGLTFIFSNSSLPVIFHIYCTSTSSPWSIFYNKDANLKTDFITGNKGLFVASSTFIELSIKKDEFFSNIFKVNPYTCVLQYFNTKIDRIPNEYDGKDYLDDLSNYPISELQLFQL